MSSCPVEDYNLAESFLGTPFQNTHAIEFIHNDVPRFGNPNNLIYLLKGTSEEQMNYIRGLLSPAIACFALFLVWALCLLYFKCRGPAKFGWLSGSRVPLPPKPKEESKVTEWENEYERIKKQHHTFKVIEIASLLIIVVAGIILCSHGVKKLIEAVFTGLDTFDLVADRLRVAAAFLDNVYDATVAVEQDAIFVLERVNGFCPRLRKSICRSIYDRSTCNTAGIEAGESILDAVTFLNQTSPFQQKLLDARDDLLNLETTINGFADDTLGINIALWLAMAFSLILSLICLSFLVALLFKMPKTVKCVQLGCTYPLFFVMVFLSFLFSLVFIVASIVLADTCYDGPLASVLKIIENNYNGKSEMILEIIKTIFGGCFEPPKRLLQNMDFVNNGVDVFSGLGSDLKGFEATRRVLCGPSEYSLDEIGNAIDETLTEYLCGGLDILNQFRGFVSCAFWYPIIGNLVNDALCYDTTDGLTGIASTQFVVVFFAGVVLTFRVALWDIDDNNLAADHDDEKNNPKSSPDESTGKGEALKEDSEEEVKGNEQEAETDS